MKQALPQRTWTILLIFTAALAVWLLWPYLFVLVFTALLAFVFYPLYLRIKRGKGYIAAGVTLAASFLVVVIPVGVLLGLAVTQLVSFAEAASQPSGQLPQFVDNAVVSLNGVLEPLTGVKPTVTEANVTEWLRTTLPEIAKSMIAVLLGIFASLPQIGVSVVIYTFVFLELLLKGPQLITKLKRISPVTHDMTERYVERIGLMANAMVKGQLMIAMIISAISAALLVPLGYGQYFAVLFIIFTILNFIPLGAAILVVPLVILAMAEGQVWQGIVVLILYYIAGYLDPVLRPRFIPKKIQLSTAVTIVAAFSGIAYFGLLGVVYGPIIVIFVLTTIDMFIESKSTKPIKPAKSTARTSS